MMEALRIPVVKVWLVVFGGRLLPAMSQKQLASTAVAVVVWNAVVCDAVCKDPLVSSTAVYGRVSSAWNARNVVDVVSSRESFYA